jgi:hypothetical protein
MKLRSMHARIDRLFLIDRFVSNKSVSADHARVNHIKLTWWAEKFCHPTWRFFLLSVVIGMKQSSRGLGNQHKGMVRGENPRQATFILPYETPACWFHHFLFTIFKALVDGQHLIGEELAGT